MFVEYQWQKKGMPFLFLLSIFFLPFPSISFFPPLYSCSFSPLYNFLDKHSIGSFYRNFLEDFLLIRTSKGSLCDFAIIVDLCTNESNSDYILKEILSHFRRSVRVGTSARWWAPPCPGPSCRRRYRPS